MKTRTLVLLGLAIGGIALVAHSQNDPSASFTPSCAVDLYKRAHGGKAPNSQVDLDSWGNMTGERDRDSFRWFCEVHPGASLHGSLADIGPDKTGQYPV